MNWTVGHLLTSQGLLFEMDLLQTRVHPYASFMWTSVWFPVREILATTFTEHLLCARH